MIFVTNVHVKLIQLFSCKFKFLRDNKQAKLYFLYKGSILLVDFILIICKSLENLDILSPKKHARNGN